MRPNVPAVATEFTATSRFHSLDALRGFAALLVVIHHFALVMVVAPYPAWIRLTPLRVVFDGYGNVLVFFVLSGFVLFPPLRDAGRIAYWPYAIKRFVRLYVPFFTAICLSALLNTLVKPQVILGVTEWFNVDSWQVPLTATNFVMHFALTDDPNRQGLDNVMWSLAQEARISIVFPIIALFVWRNWFLTVLGCLIISACSRHLYLYESHPRLYDPALTLQFVGLFAAGASLSLNRQSITRVVSCTPASARLILWSIALLGSTFSLNNSLYFLAQTSAIMIVALCFTDPHVKILFAGSIPQWLGRISYSLYLIHIPILLSFVHLLYGKLPLLEILTISLIMSLLVAELSYRFVEKPSIDLGRRWATKFRRSLPATSTSRVGPSNAADRQPL